MLMANLKEALEITSAAFSTHFPFFLLDIYQVLASARAFQFSPVNFSDVRTDVNWRAREVSIKLYSSLAPLGGSVA